MMFLTIMFVLCIPTIAILAAVWWFRHGRHRTW